MSVFGELHLDCSFLRISYSIQQLAIGAVASWGSPSKNKLSSLNLAEKHCKYLRNYLFFFFKSVSLTSPLGTPCNLSFYVLLLFWQYILCYLNAAWCGYRLFMFDLLIFFLNNFLFLMCEQTVVVVLAFWLVGFYCIFPLNLKTTTTKPSPNKKHCQRCSSGKTSERRQCAYSCIPWG